MDEVFSERFADKHLEKPAQVLSSPAPKTDAEIVAEAYHRIGANVSHIEADLRKRGINFSRKKISKILDDLGLPRERR